MNAERMAERLEQHHAAFNASAAAMLRRQHEAIVKLREALQIIGGTDAIDAALDPQRAVRVAEKALIDTEDLK